MGGLDLDNRQAECLRTLGQANFDAIEARSLARYVGVAVAMRRDMQVAVTGSKATPVAINTLPDPEPESQFSIRE